MAPVEGSGFNPDYGLLGSNKATEERVKLFPRDCRAFALAVQEKIFAATGKRVEAMVYGDGAFKDPVGKIWELADPVVSPGYTDGLEGQPSEVKLKYQSHRSMVFQKKRYFSTTDAVFTIDRSGCIGCGLCPTLCPDVFAMAEDGLAEVIVPEIPGSAESAALEAQQNKRGT